MNALSPRPDVPAAPSGSSLIRVAGRDVLAVLHRISTQDLIDLAPGQVRVTLFCDFRGRLLHRAAVAVTRDSTVWLLRDDAPPDELSAYIDRHVFREEARIESAPAGRRVRAVPRGFGRAAGTLIEHEGIPSELQLAPDFGLVVGAEADRESAPDAETERILAGRPRHGHEVEPAFNPYEVGLAHEVHLDKGCFTGQEALMRLVTYRSVRRRLALVSGPGSAPGSPRDIHRDGAAVGRLTSSTPQGRNWIGLAVLKHEALSAEGTLEIEGGAMLEAARAFPETRPQGLP